MHSMPAVKEFIMTITNINSATGTYTAEYSDVAYAETIADLVYPNISGEEYDAEFKRYRAFGFEFFGGEVDIKTLTGDVDVNICEHIDDVDGMPLMHAEVAVNEDPVVLMAGDTFVAWDNCLGLRYLSRELASFKEWADSQVAPAGVVYAPEWGLACADFADLAVFGSEKVGETINGWTLVYFSPSIYGSTDYEVEPF